MPAKPKAKQKSPSAKSAAKAPAKAGKTTAKKPLKPAKASKPAAKVTKPAPKAQKAAKPAPKKKAAPVKKAAPKKSPAKPVSGKTPPKTAKPATTPAAAAKSPVVKSKAAPEKAKVAKSVSSAPITKAAPITNGSNGSHSTTFIQKQRQRLLDLRDELVDSMSGMTRDTIRNAPEGSEASGSGQHQGDAGSDAYDRDFALSVLAKEQDALYEIEQALRRIQTGSYGICEISSKKIPQARLEAIPFARLTVECQAQWEKEYGKRKFRPSDEVGFSGGNYLDDEDSETISLDEEEE